jgi:hypothetical protein
MPGRHRGERRRRIVAAAALLLVAAACSSSGGSAGELGTTTEPPPTSAAPPPSTAAGPTTTSTVPLTITSTPVTSTGGARIGTVTAVTGTGPATVALPATAGHTAIVHAQYDGDGAFVVSSVNAQGQHLAVLAQSLGSYDGTFPVGFVDQRDNPTASLRVEATGPWHLDIANATLAPELTGAGVSGHGDAVLSYKGPAVTAHVIYPGTSAFEVSTYAGGAVTHLAAAVGPYDRRITLPAGPAFISVTADGDWSMSLG